MARAPFAHIPLLVALWGVSLGAVACGGTAQHPQDVVHQYVDDVRNRRVEAVYAVLGDELRGEMTLDDFRTFFDENYDEVLAQAEELESATNGDKMAITAALEVGEHSELTLDYEGERWVMANELPALAGAASPRGTLDALAGAMEEQDLAAILLLLSKEKSDTLRAEFDIIQAALANISEDDIVVYGDVATIYLDWGLKLELVFEDGGWRLNRLQQQK